MRHIHLDIGDVPPQLRLRYEGRKFKVFVAKAVEIPIDAGLWSGGSRDTYVAIRITDGAKALLSSNASPFSMTRLEQVVTLVRGIVVVRHSIF